VYEQILINAKLEREIKNRADWKQSMKEVKVRIGL